MKSLETSLENGKFGLKKKKFSSESSDFIFIFFFKPDVASLIYDMCSTWRIHEPVSLNEYLGEGNVLTVLLPAAESLAYRTLQKKTKKTETKY